MFVIGYVGQNDGDVATYTGVPMGAHGGADKLRPLLSNFWYVLMNNYGTST